MEGGTGVYYQAMPAVGPDGRNVMKLIPVQKVNGQFFQAALNTEKDSLKVQLNVLSKSVFPPVVSSSQSQTRVHSLQPIANGRYVLKAPPQDSTLFNSPKVQHSGTTNVHVPVAKPPVSQDMLQSPPQTNIQPTAVVQKLPVTVKSPVLPSGHCLQIPPCAQVRSVPTSALPQSIKSHIINHVSVTPTNDKVQPTVIMVSPVNSVKLNSDHEMFLLTKPSQIQKALSQHLPVKEGSSSPVSSPLNYQTGKEVTTPMKWVVQEETGIRGPCLVPASSTQVNPVTLKSITGASEIVANKPTSTQISQEKITFGKDDALVMYNGKVYLLAKKNSEIAKDVMISEGGRKGVLSVSPDLPASSALGSDTSKRDPKIKASEIIDLCDDDESSTSLGGSPGNLPTQSQTEGDESNEDSNVIFVSYIPPKSEMEKNTKSASGNKREDNGLEEMEINVKSASQNENERTAHEVLEIDEGKKNTAAEEGGAQMDVEEQVMEPEPAEMNVSSLCENVNMEGEKQLKSGNLPGTIGDTPNDDGADVGETVSDRDGVVEQLHNACVPATDNTKKTSENPVSVQKTQKKSDGQLRKEFGVTSDVQICLQRVRPTKRPEPQAERLIINKRTLDGLRKVIQESKLQSKIKMMMQVPHSKTEDDEGLEEIKRNKLDQDVHQDNSSLSTANISPASECKDKSENISVFPMETSLISHTCQEEVCPSSHKTAEIAESTASKIHMQSEKSTDSTGDAHCLTPSSELNVTQTTVHIISPSSGLRKTSARSKKGKMCTACPCSTLLGVTETTSSLQSQDTPPAVVESHKEARKSLQKTPRECCQPIADSVKKARKKRSSSPRKKKSPSTKALCKTTHSKSSPDSSVKITTSFSASSSSLQESNMQDSPSLNETQFNSHTQTETTEQNTSIMQIASNETSVSSSSKQQDSIRDNLPTQDLYSVEVLDAEEIKRQERIERLKDLLKIKEAALERMRHSMNV